MRTKARQGQQRRERPGILKAHDTRDLETEIENFKSKADKTEGVKEGIMKDEERNKRDRWKISNTGLV